MKQVYLILIVALFMSNANAQCFKKGSLLISLSEGTSYTTFSTSTPGNTGNSGTTANNGGTDVIHTDNITGVRDPITIEYGLTNHWGIGINMGGDIYHADPSKFYGFQTATNDIKVITSELTLDANYHFFVTRHFDLAAFTSLGFSSVSFNGNDGDHSYQYRSGGLLVRTGTKARYYITKRFGVLAMVSTFATRNGTDGVKGNTVGNGYTTTVKGSAIEFGLCYRVLR